MSYSSHKIWDNDYPWRSAFEYKLQPKRLVTGNSRLANEIFHEQITHQSSEKKQQK